MELPRQALSESSLETIQRFKPKNLHLSAFFRVGKLAMVHCHLSFLRTFAVEADAQTRAAIPFCSHVFARRCCRDFHFGVRQPALPQLLIGPRRIRLRKRNRHRSASRSAEFSVAFLEFLPDAALTFVADGDHLAPPGGNLVRITEIGGNFFMRPLLGAGLVEDFEPLGPNFPRL